MSCRMVDALVLWHQGLPEQARARTDEALRTIRGLEGTLMLAAPGLLFSILLAPARRMPAETRELSAELVQVSTAQGYRLWKAAGLMSYGWALGTTSDPGRGLAAMEQGLQQFAALGNGLNVSYSLSLQAELLLSMGRPAEALAVLERALAQAARLSEGRWTAEMHRLRGELLLRTGASAEAAFAAFTRARELAAAQGARMLELRALCSLVRAGADAGARAALATLYASFTEGLDEPDLRDARALLEEEGAQDEAQSGRGR